MSSEDYGIGIFGDPRNLLLDQGDVLQTDVDEGDAKIFTAADRAVTEADALDQSVVLRRDVDKGDAEVYALIVRGRV